MEIREYDSSYDCLNKHIMNDKNIYNIKRYPPIILTKDKELIEKTCNNFKFSKEYFEEHIVYFKKYDINKINISNNLPWVINVNYHPFGTTYYHAVTEILPNALFLISKINVNIPIYVSQSSFINNLCNWFEIKNPIITSINMNIN